jgi:stage V sporulation protein B
MTDTLETPDDARELDEASAEETAKTTGRGFIVITAAKLYFMVTGAAVQLGLPILFGSAQQFGVFKLVTEAVSLINMVVITGSLQAVAKLVSEDPRRSSEVLNAGLKIQLALGVPLFVLYAVASPWIASGYFNDPSLGAPMQLSSLIILFYAFYATFVGYLNGRKLFVHQAALDITFQTMKTAGILGLVVAGAGVMGAVGGFAGAAGAIALISGVVTIRLMRKNPDPPLAEDAEPTAARFRRLAGFLVGVMVYTFALNGLMRADLFVLKSVASSAPEALSSIPAVFGAVSDKIAGFYGAALNLSRLPYQGVIAATFVIFPLISEATSLGDSARTRAYIQDAFRYCLLLIACVALPLAFNSDSLIAGLYSADYRAAGDALAILTGGMISFSLLYVAMTVIIGAGRPLVAIAIMATSLGISVALNYWLILGLHEEVVAQLTLASVPPAGGATAPELLAWAAQSSQAKANLAADYVARAPDYMRAGATATAVSMTAGFIASIGWLYKEFEAVPPLATTARLIVACGVLYGVDLAIPLDVAVVATDGKIFFLGLVAAKMTAMGVALLAVLALTREFGAADIARALAVVGRKPKAEDTDTEPLTDEDTDAPDDTP